VTWTTADLPDLSGRTAVVTGANAGIGLETARQLRRRGANIVLACRDTGRGAAARDDLLAEPGAGTLELEQLDLASLASVRAFAERFLATHDELDLLVNNAGIMMVPQGTTEDGFERQLGTNHLGHFALTGLLLPALLAAPEARVVSVSSIAHRGASVDLSNLQYEQGGYTPSAAYGRSKLANLLFTFELQRRLGAIGADVSSLAAHPGISATNLADHLLDRWWARPLRPVFQLLVQDAADGALPSLRAATDPELTGGAYVGPDGRGERSGAPVLVGCTPQARDQEVAAGLWEASVALTGVDYAALAAAG
jgi:NAD(P)-dependent dehydrogenase (short-subunit alcohol dehydrogenase family)